MDVHNGEILGLGSFPTFDPTDVHPPADPEGSRRDLPRPGRRRSPTARSPGLYPTGSTFKIITALAALENGVVTPSDERSTTPANLIVGGQTFSQRGRSGQRRRSAWSRRCEVSSDVYFYDTRLTDVGQGLPAAVGAQARDRRATRASTCPARRQGPAADQAVARQARRRRRSWKGGPGRRATTSSWRPARATCRPTRCRWRSPTRPSATAAPSSPRTSARKSTTPAGRVLKEFDPPPQRHVHIDPDLPGGDPRRPARRRAEPERDLLRRLRRLSRSRSPARPGPRSGRRTKTSPGTRSWRPTRTRRSSPS